MVKKSDRCIRHGLMNLEHLRRTLRLDNGVNVGSKKVLLLLVFKKPIERVVIFHEIQETLLEIPKINQRKVHQIFLCKMINRSRSKWYRCETGKWRSRWLERLNCRLRSFQVWVCFMVFNGKSVVYWSCSKIIPERIEWNQIS